MVVSGMRMISVYLNLNRAAYRRSWRVMTVLTYVTVSAQLLYNWPWHGALPPLLLNAVINLALLVLLCLGIYLMIAEARRGSWAARWFLIANSAVFLGALLATLRLLLRYYGHVTQDSILLEKSVQIGTAVQVALLSISVSLRVREVRHERELSDRILHEVLPPSIANRLKSGETGIAERFDSVTVLFADIAGFTPLSAQLPPEIIVQTLNAIFSRFDELTSRFGLEKIKTIGDCYMVVAGLPLPRADHQSVMAQMALELLTAVRAYATEARAAGTLPPGTRLEMRIGVHSGPVVAGVIGTRRFAYDLWGDTVNTASRMESHGEPGRIHCSPAFYEGLRDAFAFEARGQVAIKGKGLMSTYFLLGPMPRTQRTPE
jgi:class 3 adenylate cyclase